MSRKRKVKTTNACCFCHREPDDSTLGKFFVSKHGFGVHQYCMFFSANLPQNGGDHEGFEGFLETDIIAEYRRAGRMTCCICRQKGASSGCITRSCKKSFHYPCGVEQKYLFQFFGVFRSYCYDHRLVQKNPVASSLADIQKTSQCVICLEDVQSCCTPDVLRSPCCKNTWFHRSCLQQQAAASGYFFRCPVCNDDDKFRDEMKHFGIYVPDRDAAWEEGGNFEDLLEKYERCDQFPCKCPSGNMFCDETGPWEIVLCSSCGQYGVHVGCRQWDVNPPSFYCPTCIAVHNDNQVDVLSSNVVSDSSEGTSQEIQEQSHTVNRRERMHLRRKSPSEDINDDGTDSESSIVFNGVMQHRIDEDFLHTRLPEGQGVNTGNISINDTENRAIISKHKTPTQEDNGRVSSHTEQNNMKKTNDLEEDCFITKYIPGNCRICPNCHRRKAPKNIKEQRSLNASSTTNRRVPQTPQRSYFKHRYSSPMNTPTSFKSHFKFPRKVMSPSTPSMTPPVTSSMTSPPLLPNMSSSLTTPSVSLIHGVTSPPVSGRSSGVFNWVGNAHDSITSYFSSLNKPPTSSSGGGGGGSGIQVHSGGDGDRQQSVSQLVNDVTIPAESWLSSMERIFKLFNPTTNQESTEASTNQEQPSETSSTEQSITSKAPLPSNTIVDDDDNDDVDSTASEEFIFTPPVTRSKNRLAFPRTDPNKSVLEAALEHAYELRSSGKEMTHQCLTSY